MFGRQARMLLNIIIGMATPDLQIISHYTLSMAKSLEKVYQLLRSHFGTAAERQKEQHNHRVHGNPYKVGDQVWLHNSVVPRGSSKNTLSLDWPFQVIKYLSDTVYSIQDVETWRVRMLVHFDRLKPYCTVVYTNKGNQQGSLTHGTMSLHKGNVCNGTASRCKQVILCIYTLLSM